MTAIRTTLVGTQPHQGPEAVTLVIGLRLGDELELRREADNRFDRNAVACWFRGRKLGFIPRKQNAPIAEAMDAGTQVRTVVTDPALSQGNMIREVPRLSVEWSGGDG
jgi:hypothetical protein